MTSEFWNKVYETKDENAVSWYQELPKRSLETILSLNLPKNAKIIDVGGGRSKLSESLYSNSYHDLTILDISDVALSKSKEKLDELFPDNQIITIASNIVEAKFSEKYDVWHDRAVFHFLTNPDDQKKYVNLVMDALKPNGHLLIFTFSKKGPLKCSGLEICQYDKEDLVNMLPKLKLVGSGTEDHHTPFNTIQNFTYCLFKKSV